MADLRSLKNKKQLSIPKVESYEVIQDSNSVGFKVKIIMSADSDLIALRVYKAKISKPLLKKSYTINQIALQKVTGMKSFGTQNTTLFNKSFFSQNSKLKFQDSNSNRFDQKESTITNFQYKEIAFLRNDGHTIEFIDKNVKFGETYSYVISGLSTLFFESTKTKPLLINIEDLKHPSKPDFVKLDATAHGILITAGNNIDKDVVGFDIYRKENNNKFEYVDRLNKPFGSHAAFLDTDVFPLHNYQYKIFSVDLYDNLSFESYNDDIVFSKLFELRENAPIPQITILGTETFIQINGFNDNENIIGYKIERQDVWRREVGFSLKTSLFENWPNLSMFQNNQILFLDYSAKLGRNYRYRITSINKMGYEVAYFVTPIIEFKPELLFSNVLQKNDSLNSVKIKNFDVGLVDLKQRPLTLVSNFEIVGDWDYIIFNINDSKVRVENIHNRLYLNNLIENTKYRCKIQVFSDGILQATSSEVSLNT